MKLLYTGKHIKAYRIVSRANELLVSPFFKSQVDNLLVRYNKKEYLDKFRCLLEADDEILVKTNFSFFSKRRFSSKSNAIYANRLKLNVSHRELLASLMQSFLDILDNKYKVSTGLKFKSTTEKEKFFKDFGVISKSYI